MTTFSIVDETISGASINTIDISFDAEEITLKDIITARVTKEVEQYNSKGSRPDSVLVTPTYFERTLNKLKTLAAEPTNIVDGEQQIYVALDGFLKNQFFVFINDVQIESLDKKFRVSEIDKISFIKLTPLIGG